MPIHIQQTFKRSWLPLLVIPLLLASLLASPQQALAQFGIVGIQPSRISNSTSSIVVITGSEFAEGATVLLEGYGTLETAFASTSVLRATVPAGVPEGVYSVTVINADGSTDTADNALTVTEVQETPIPSSDTRPLLVVDRYWTEENVVSPNSRFTLWVRFLNAGQVEARNAVVTFSGEDYMPLDTGGVVALGSLASGDKRKMEQGFATTWGIFGQSVSTLSMQVVYSDDQGVSYSENFNLSLGVVAPAAQAATSTPTPTPTATPRARPQMVITAYDVDLETLQPGSIFKLDIDVTNVGNTLANRLTMIVGGGSSSSGGPATTPDPSIPGGGVSGAGGDFNTFAPVSSSNVQYLGELAQGQSAKTGLDLIVNSSASPGAFPLKISFTYTTSDGTTYTDDQVVTLLVYAPPLVDVNFYRPADMLFAGQPASIPLQVVNLGRKAVVLGSMQVTSENAMIENGETLVGTLDTGFPFTFDPMLIPNQPGPLEVQIAIHYTDDFNVPQVITKTLSFEVGEAPVYEPPPESEMQGEGMPIDGGMTGGGSETTWQKILRFIKGLFGLDSGQQQNMPGEIPPMEMPEESVPGGPAKG